MKKYCIQSYGCQMNVADSEALAADLRRRGLQATNERAEADVIVLNTCTVRDQVELKAMAYIGRLKPLKERNPDLKIMVVGCAAQRLGEKLRKKFPFVDLVAGAGESGSYAARLDTVLGHAADHPGCPEPEANGAASAFVTIMRGCNNFCSYCIVPHVRGRESSRPVTDILTETRSLAKQGVKDITFLGQNVNSYAGTLPDGTPADLSDLLRLASEVEGIRRLRFTTNHPKDLSDKLLKTMADTAKICKHIHLPLQSGSDRILQAMNRGYCAADYTRLAAKIRQAIPGISLTTDIMVGFPGETEEDFQATLRLVQDTGFNALFAYKYSPREGTASYTLADNVPHHIKEERLAAVLALSRQISQTYNARFLGTTQHVLVETKKATLCTARTDSNLKVYFHAPTPTITVGSFVPIKITQCRITTLVGVVQEDNVTGGSASLEWSAHQ